MPDFKVGDKVSWGSQAGGCHTKKAGKILLVLQPGVRPLAALETYVGTLGGVFKTYITHAIDARTLPRKTESYIIEVPAKGKGKARLYWPLVSRLVKED